MAENELIIFEDLGPDPTKHTAYHTSVHEYDEPEFHYIAPRQSEQPDQGTAVRVEADVPEWDSHKPKLCPVDLDMGTLPFTPKMEPTNYSECVTVAKIPTHVEESCVALCEMVQPERYKTEVVYEEKMAPVLYRDRVTVYTSTAKQRYKSQVLYEPKNEKSGYRETCYVHPKRLEKKFVSYLDYNTNKQRNHYISSVEMTPKTYSSTELPFFKMRVPASEDLAFSDPRNRYENDGEYNDHVILQTTDYNSNVESTGVHIGPKGNVNYTSPESFQTKMVVGGYQPDLYENGYVNGDYDSDGAVDL